jgi:hypothetical protein
MSLAPDARRRPTRILVFLMAIVAVRFVEVRTGWSDAIVFPLVAFAALAVFDVVATAREQRLSAADWVLNAVFAVLAGLGLWMAGA